MEARRLADLHAYVDDCLEPDERLAFEQQMAQDPALGAPRRAWRAQNSAIRAAFDGEGARAFSISLVRHQNEVLARADGRPRSAAKPSGEQPARFGIERRRGRARDLRRRSRASSRASAVAVMAAGPRGVVRRPCLRSGLRPRPSSPPKDLARPALRLSAHSPVPALAPVEFATGDRTESEAWLTTRLMHPVYLPATPSALKLDRGADRSLPRRAGGVSALQGRKTDPSGC